MWDDLDLDGRKATISKGIVRGELTSTKTGKERVIDLTPSLVAELRKLRQKTRSVVNGSFRITLENSLTLITSGAASDM